MKHDYIQSVRPRAIASLSHKPEHFGAKRIRGRGEQSFVFYSRLDRRVEPQEIHHDMSNDGEVVGGKPRAYAALVFIELDIQTPVEPISTSQ